MCSFCIPKKKFAGTTLYKIIQWDKIKPVDKFIDLDKILNLTSVNHT